MLKLNYERILQIFALSFFILVSFYIFSFAVKEDLLRQFDFNMTVRIQDKVPLRLDSFLSSFSLLGSFETTFLILLAIIILFIRKISSFFIIGAFGFAHVVEIFGKALLDQPGTPFLFHRYSLDIIFPTSYVQPGFSYPSGHAMRTAFLSIILAYLILKSKKLRLEYKVLFLGLIGMLALIMFASRVSLGEHWTTDVIGGILLGGAFGVFSVIFIPEPKNKPKS